MSIFQILVLLSFLAIVVSLASGFVFAMKDTGNSTRAVKALTLRVGLSVTLFAVLMICYGTGLVSR